MEITLYKFSKRVNSTKRPSGGTTKNVVWKEKTDLHNPTVKCQSTETGQYNYMKIGDHYYWIVSEVLMPNGWIEWTGDPDPMAICADEIKATTAFIERSASGTTLLLDPFAPAQANETTEVLGESAVPYFSSKGTYIITLANHPLPMVMNFQDFNTLYEQLNSENVIKQLENSIVRIEEIITGAIWLPLETVLSQGTIEIKAGFVSTGITGNIVSDAPIVSLTGISVPGGTILESSAYSELYLYLPFVGSVGISPDQFKDGYISVETTVDPTNGSLMYKILNNSGAVVATYSGTCGISIPIGGTSFNGASVATAIGMVAAAATGNWLVAGAMAGAMAFGGTRTVSTINGGGGSRAGLNRLSVGLYRIKRTPPEALTLKSKAIGLPTYRTGQIGSYSGFIKCVGASIEAAQEGSIIEACNNYLNTGAYIE